MVRNNQRRKTRKMKRWGGSSGPESPTSVVLTTPGDIGADSKSVSTAPPAAAHVTPIKPRTNIPGRGEAVGRVLENMQTPWSPSDPPRRTASGKKRKGGKRKRTRKGKKSKRKGKKSRRSRRRRTKKH